MVRVIKNKEKLTPTQKDELYSLMVQGCKNSQLAKQFNVATTTIGEYKRKFNLG